MEDSDSRLPETTSSSGGEGFSLATIALLKGIVYQESDPALWQQLLNFQTRIRDYVAQIGLELIIDEAEGYGWLRTRPTVEGEPELPRLVSRRQLPFAVSLLLALLRKRLAEFDSSGAEQRLVLSRDEIIEMVRIFHPQGSNEAKLMQQIERHINKVIELGFLRKMRGSEQMVEVQRTLKAFVDAQWLREFDLRLQQYQQQLQQESP